METNFNFFGENASTKDKKAREYQESVSAFGAYTPNGTLSFEHNFNELANRCKEQGIDIKRDMKAMVGNREFMNEYKEALLGPIIQGFTEASPDDPHIKHIAECASDYWDTKVNILTESASVTGFLPIAPLEFPVLAKQFFSTALKDIIDIGTTKTPQIQKHIRTNYLVDNETGDEYEYPKCLFDGSWEKIWDAAKGIKLEDKVHTLPLYNFDIVSATPGTVPIDRLSLQIKISAIEVAGEVIPLRGNGIVVDLATNGTLINGSLNFEHNGTQIVDHVSGQVNFKDGTVTVVSASGTVTGVVFEGYLSNEKNLRTVSVREKRDLIRFTVEDGARWNMPFSIEEIDDASALLDMNYYNRMVDEVIKGQEVSETMVTIKYLADEYNKFANVDTDIWNLDSTMFSLDIDLEPPTSFAGDPFAYISTIIQFKLKALIYKIGNTVKLEGLSYVIVGNPMACQLVSKFTEWKTQQGSTIGGIKLANSYGFATDLGANVRVVATNLYDPYSPEVHADTGSRELQLHVYVYPTDNEHISYKHVKYTNHIFTSQNQTAYQSLQAPNGAYNIVTATSRFKTFAIQGIQARINLLGGEKFYGIAPSKGLGAPWEAPTA